MAVNVRQENLDATNRYGGGKGPTQLPGGNTVTGREVEGMNQQRLAQIDLWNSHVHDLDNQPAQPMFPGGTNTGGGGRGGRGGGGGGGISAAKAQLLGNKYFNYNAAPALMQIAAIRDQGAQANAYNPNFQQIAQPYMQQAAQGYQQSNAAAGQALQQGQQFNNQQNAQMGSTLHNQLRDLQGQGVGNINPYMSQAMPAMQGVNDVGNINQQYMAAMNAANQSSQQDYINQAQLLAQGGHNELVNNRNVLQNQLRQQELTVEDQAAQQRQALEQQKMQFLLKYGVS